MVVHRFGASSGCQSGSLVYATCTRMVSEASWMITGCLPSRTGIEALLEASVHVEGFSIIAQVDYRTSSLFFRSEPWMLHSRTKEHSNVDRTYIEQAGCKNIQHRFQQVDRFIEQNHLMRIHMINQREPFNNHPAKPFNENPHDQHPTISIQQHPGFQAMSTCQFKFLCNDPTHSMNLIPGTVSQIHSMASKAQHS